MYTNGIINTWNTWCWNVVRKVFYFVGDNKCDVTLIAYMGAPANDSGWVWIVYILVVITLVRQGVRMRRSVVTWPLLLWCSEVSYQAFFSQWPNSFIGFSSGLLSFSSVGQKAEYGLTIYFGLYHCSQLTKSSCMTTNLCQMYIFLGDNYQNRSFTYNSIIDGWNFQWDFESFHCKFYWMWTSFVT